MRQALTGLGVLLMLIFWMAGTLGPTLVILWVLWHFISKYW